MILFSAAAPPFMKNGYVLGCERTRESVIIDPGEELVGLLFTQYMPMDFAMQNQFTTLLLQTVAD